MTDTSPLPLIVIPAPGAIWRDRDQRRGGRLVRVLAVHDGQVRSQSCTAAGATIAGAPLREVELTRFTKRFAPVQP
jgi:hypothetical protein